MIGGNTQQRNFVVRLATLFFVAILIEGAVRKWVVFFPPFEQGVLFVKDILIFVCLAYAIATNRISTSSSLFVVFLAGTLISLILIVTQLVTFFSIQSTILMYYGWRNYFLMIAMAQIVIDNFSEGDVRRIMRISFIVIMISAPLMIIQSAFPPNHVFNAGFGEFTEDYFSNATFSAGIVRAAGVFTAPPGNTTFILASGAFLLGAFADGRTIVESSIAKLMLAVTFAIDCLYSGARTLFFVFPFILIFHLIALAIAGPGRAALRTAAAVSVVMFTGWAIITLVNPNLLDAYQDRFTSAADVEAESGGTPSRVAHAFTGFFDRMFEAPTFGYGLGMGSNAAMAIGAIAPENSAEDDWERHVVDLGGPLALAYIGLRIGLAVWAVYIGAMASMRTRRTAPLTLAGFVFYVMMAGQLTGNATINALGWMSFGLSCAYSRAPLKSVSLAVLHARRRQQRQVVS